ncbi:MAG: Holliday junction branch migration protein RuvA [Chloroflexi bacterium]|nr:Holliday junction branch migration protein RuvA [Chloroflexota bacterium]
MITAVRGTVEATGPDWVEIGIGGVSVRVNVPALALDQIGPIGSQARLHTCLVVREDALSLYGFPSPEAVRLFRLLLEVNGVGPRLGLSILSTLTPEAVAVAIASGDGDSLTRAPGVGKKTAARVILELREKLEKEWGPVPAFTSQSNMDVVAALAALGYSANEVRQAVASVPSDKGLSLEERVRLALRRLGSSP